MCLVFAKVVEDILVGGPEIDLREFIDRLSKVYKMGTIVHMPREFKFSPITVHQY